MDANQLADFLRVRRQTVQPEEVGLPRGPRRRIRGLRREEVAALSAMSADYYGRLERGIGHRPSEVLLAAIARSLCLVPEEKEHLFKLAGHAAPPWHAATPDHPDAGLVRMLDRLVDTPAAIVTAVGETLVQTPVCVEVFGDETRSTGHARCAAYRWSPVPGVDGAHPRAGQRQRGAPRAARPGLERV